MFRINANKLEDKLLNEVFTDLGKLETEDIVKYCLAIKYITSKAEFKEVVCLAGTVIGASCFFAFSAPIPVALCATGAIAGLIKARENYKEFKRFDKLHKALAMALGVFFDADDKVVKQILDRLTAEDLVNFLEKEGILGAEEA